MLKFLLITALAIYILSKIGGFFFRAGAASQRRQNPNANANASRKNPKSGNFKGGEYVDYEDVK